MNLTYRNVHLRHICALALLATISSHGISKSTVVRDGSTELRVSDDPVLRRCVVIATSGSYETDQQACKRASAAVPSNTAGLPEGTYLFPGRDRRYAGGTCVYPNKVRPAKEDEAVCGRLLNGMGSARVAMAIKPDSWIRSADLGGLRGNSRPVALSIGISPEGKASYCVVARSSGNAEFDALICQLVSMRAKFDPALNSEGQPIPSAYDRGWSL
jgi:hypothetical protein